MLADARAAGRGLIQLTPEGAGGVMDYALCLQRQWRDMGEATHLVALSQARAGEQALVERLHALARSPDQPLTLLLHFSGYGFERRGLCGWLVHELDDARARLGSRLRLVTMFHELFASGPAWTSAFWFASAQARIAARVARTSDQLMTNSLHHARCLRVRLRVPSPVRVWPVFSTIGEPDHVAPADERAPHLVVFGAESTRRRALSKLADHTAGLRQLGITNVIEAGPGASAWSSSQSGDIACRFEGLLDAPALSALLAGSAYALIDYPSIHLGKSTVFAACVAHGCVVLDTAPAGPDADGLMQGRHFVTLESKAALAAIDRRAVSNAGRAWYAGHRLARQAESMAALCGVGYGMEPVDA